jgi:hypothetical protein
MIQACCKVARFLRAGLLAALAAASVPAAARAAFVADPVKLYQEMKEAYAKDQAAGWSFRTQEEYLATIVNAGRAYSLQYPTDPAYGELAALTVQIGAGLHYNPLINHDAAVWWVREAANWVLDNSKDPQLLSDAQALLERTNSEDDPQRLARLADEDATANLKNYPGDVDALLIQVEADWRAFLLTRDPKWRSLALARAAAPNFPVAHLPTGWGNELLNAADMAQPGKDGYTQDDLQNAQTLLARVKAVSPLRTIASVTALPEDKMLTMLAPADEYFGPMGYSILGIENELKHINFMLDYHYGNRESGITVQVAKAIDAMHKVYPRDRDLPKLLYWCYTTLERMTDTQAERAAAHLKGILTVEYQDSPQARKLLPG